MASPADATDGLAGGTDDIPGLLPDCATSCSAFGEESSVLATSSSGLKEPPGRETGTTLAGLPGGAGLGRIILPPEVDCSREERYFLMKSWKMDASGKELRRTLMYMCVQHRVRGIP